MYYVQTRRYQIPTINEDQVLIQKFKKWFSQTVSKMFSGINNILSKFMSYHSKWIYMNDLYTCIRGVE